MRIERLLIVGFGSIGQRHARVVRAAQPHLQIWVLRRPESARVESSAVDRFVSTLAEAMQLAPQAAIIANPAPLHLETAEPLLEAGVHLLIEKPLATTASLRTMDLIRRSGELGVVLMVGYNLRFAPSLQQFRGMLRAGHIGRTLSVRTEVGQYLPSWRPAADYRQSVSARADLGGGVLLELSHEIDYIRHLFGEIEWVSATLRRDSDLELDVEDAAYLHLGLRQVECSQPLVASLSMDCFRRDPTRVSTALGSDASLRWNAMTGTVELFNPTITQGWTTVYASPSQGDATYAMQWQHFVHAVERAPAAGAQASDALAVLNVIDAARQSAATGCRTSVRAIP